MLSEKFIDNAKGMMSAESEIYTRKCIYYVQFTDGCPTDKCLIFQSRS